MLEARIPIDLPVFTLSAAFSGMQCLRRLPSSPWQCMLTGYLYFPSLIPVQAPGIRPSDILYKNSAAVQGVEALRDLYAVYSLATRI
jgi:hypothetical protein